MYTVHHRQKRILGILTSDIEIKDLLRAWAILALAFTIMFNGLSFGPGTGITFLLSVFIVGTGFLLHELAHKLVAQHYDCWAEFRAFDMMLWFALFLSIFGFIFAAPGAVMIHGHILKKEYGKISLAGPLVNLLLGVLFLVLSFLPLPPLFTTFVSYGLLINVWLGLFNLIPFGNFDGQKILAWSKIAYILMVAFAVILLIAQQILNTSLAI